jgi:hypothetical protein
MFLGIDWGKFIDLQFWLTSNPGDLSRTFEIVFVVILAITYGGYFITKGAQKKYGDLKNGTLVEFYRKVGTMLITMAVIFTFLFFLREEGVPFLGGRYMFLLWIITFVVWVIVLAFYYFRTIPRIIKERAIKATPTQNFNNRYAR